MLNVSLKLLVICLLISYGCASYYTSLKKLSELVKLDLKAYETVEKLCKDESDDTFRR